MKTIDFKVPPVIKTITYAGSPEDAFDRFTRDIGRWWPLATHSLGKADNASSVGFERLEAGGELVERPTSDKPETANLPTRSGPPSMMLPF